MFLLDTNVVSELRKAQAGKADTNVVAWARPIDPDLLFVSSLTVHEIEVGVLRKERRDPVQGLELRRWLEQMTQYSFAGRILPIDARIAQLAAGFRVPDPAPLEDSLIAATALAHNMTVVTRNVSDFARTGARLLNPWEPQSL